MRAISRRAAGENIVALCDVDTRRSGDTFKKFPEARQYRDFRKMFDEMDKQIDAVLVATPDHTHAVAAMAAIQRGKHVYCEKPLAHSVWEVRQLVKAAQQHKVVTQLGNQGHSSGGIRSFCEWIWDGAIGNVHTIHAGCDSCGELTHRPARETQGEARDPTRAGLGPLAGPGGRPAVSSGLSAVPVARLGAVRHGRAGRLGLPRPRSGVLGARPGRARRRSRPKVEDYDRKTQGDAFPQGAASATSSRPTTNAARSRSTGTAARADPAAEGMEPDGKPLGTGAVVLGDKGGNYLRLARRRRRAALSREKMKAYKQPAKKLPRVEGHHQDWLDAIRKGGQAGSDLSYGGPLTEIGLLGVIAIKLAGVKNSMGRPGDAFHQQRRGQCFREPTLSEGVVTVEMRSWSS